jgi:hypothetical protein
MDLRGGGCSAYKYAIARVRVRLHGCAIAWVCDWVCDCMGVRLHGCAIAWVCDCTGVRLHGCAIARVRVLWAQVSLLPAPRSPSSLAPYSPLLAHPLRSLPTPRSSLTLFARSLLPASPLFALRSLAGRYVLALVYLQSRIPAPAAAQRTDPTPHYALCYMTHGSGRSLRNGTLPAPGH